jgi:hypothetical protein
MFSSRIEQIKKIISVFIFLRNTRGRIFSITFITVDGRERTLNCKTLYTPQMIRGHYPVLENNLLHRNGKDDCIRAFKAGNVKRLKCGNEIITYA